MSLISQALLFPEPTFFSIACNLFSFPLLVSKLTFLKPHLLCIAKKSSLMNFLYFVRLFPHFPLRKDFTTFSTFFCHYHNDKQNCMKLVKDQSTFYEISCRYSVLNFLCTSHQTKILCFSRLKTIYFQINPWIIIYIYMSYTH